MSWKRKGQLAFSCCWEFNNSLARIHVTKKNTYLDRLLASYREKVALGMGRLGIRPGLYCLLSLPA